MKKFLSILACFCFLLVGGIALTACGEPKLTGIRVDTQDAHTAFVTGENFTTEGLKVKAVYDNKTEKDLELDEKVTISEAVKGETKVAANSAFSEIGTYTVTVKYEYAEEEFFETTYDVEVTYLKEEAGVALVSNEAELQKALQHYSSAKLTDDVVLTSTVAVTKEFTLDLAGHKISNTVAFWHEETGSENDKWSLVSVKANGKLTVKGNGEFDALKDDVYALDVVGGGELTIENGKFVGNVHAVYVFEGTCTINGGEFDVKQLANNGTKDFLINCKNEKAQSGDAKIVVKGGVFHGFNPADLKNDDGKESYLVDGFISEKTTDEAEDNNDVWTVKVDENRYYANDAATLEAALNHDNAYVVLTSDIVMTDANKNFVVTNKNVTLDLAGHKISNTIAIWHEEAGSENDRWSLVSVKEGGQLTVTGNGEFDALENDVYALDVVGGGELTIENGKFVGNMHAIYVFEGTCTINGGEFDIKQLTDGNKNFLLNCKNENAKAGTATIVVKGGKFHGFNPADLHNDDGKTSYLPQGYSSSESQSVWTVTANA